MSWPLNFRLTDSEVQVRVGRWVVRRVAFSDIRKRAWQPGGACRCGTNIGATSGRYATSSSGGGAGGSRRLLLIRPSLRGFLDDLRRRAGLPPLG
jgi:hypothetical protein